MLNKTFRINIFYVSLRIKTTNKNQFSQEHFDLQTKYLIPESLPSKTQYLMAYAFDPSHKLNKTVESKQCASTKVNI